MDMQERYEQITQEKQAAFYGKTYRYTSASYGIKRIGVMQGLGGNIWIVAFFKDNGSRKSVNTSRLPPNEDPSALQKMLDDWAAQKGLEEATP